MSNQDVLLGYYGDFANNDFEKMQAERFHPDITWTMPGHHPMSGTMQGADAVIAFLKQLYTAGIRVDNVHLGELDDGTLIERHTGHGQIGSEEFIFPTCTTYGFKDGKIADVHVHTGDQHNVDRYFWTVFKLKSIPERLAEK
jgi:hypothetical protein